MGGAAGGKGFLDGRVENVVEDSVEFRGVLILLGRGMGFQPAIYVPDEKLINMNSNIPWNLLINIFFSFQGKKPYCLTKI